MEELGKSFQNLVEVVEKLRGPQGCPWDREQTPQSLIPFVVEEAYELAEAIEAGKKEEIVDELGDYLFQVFLQAQIASEKNDFTLNDVIKNLSEKMIRRHPHVFSDTEWKTSSEVLANWDGLKEKEKTRKIFSHPVNLPGLYAAQKIGTKTKKWDFDWENAQEVFAKVEEEIAELKAEVFENGTREKLRHELGDVLFSLAQLARHLDLQAEECIKETNQRFQKRFLKMIESVGSEREAWIKLSKEEKEKRWEEVKSRK